MSNPSAATPKSKFSFLGMIKKCFKWLVSPWGVALSSIIASALYSQFVLGGTIYQRVLNTIGGPLSWVIQNAYGSLWARSRNPFSWVIGADPFGIEWSSLQVLCITVLGLFAQGVIVTMLSSVVSYVSTITVEESDTDDHVQ